MTQEEKNKIILDNWDKEGLANGWVNEHIKNNELKQQVEYLQSKIDKAIEYIINHSEEYKPHFRKIELDTVQCNELLNILEEDK